MKRILISVICVIMCCTFLCQYVSAATAETIFNITTCQWLRLEWYQNGTYVNRNTESYTAVKNSDNYYHFDVDIGFNDGSLTSYDWAVQLLLRGTWTENSGDNELLWLTFRFSNVMDVAFNYDELLNIPIKLWMFSKSGKQMSSSDYAISTISDTEYLMTFMLNMSDFNTFNIVNDLDYFQILLPAEPNITHSSSPSGTHTQVSSFDFEFYIAVDYKMPDINYDELILNEVSNSNIMLEEIISNQENVVKEIVATREVIEANGEKLQEISDKQNTIITELEQLPGTLRDIEVGDPYDKSLDTSDIAAYESAYDKVMDEVDVDQVVSIMDGGISLNQDGMYNDQSFDSVSGLMTNIIEATGLMPLIILTLTFGLACFIIGRSGKL